MKVGLIQFCVTSLDKEIRVGSSCLVRRSLGNPPHLNVILRLC